VLGDSGKVESRNVVASNWSGGWWIVDGGLAAGDRVLVDGVQKVAVGQAVRTVPFQAAGDTTLSTRMDSTIFAAPSAAPPVTTQQRSGVHRP
jgi:membrane fusion protein (multidrug efflux system)